MVNKLIRFVTSVLPVANTRRGSCIRCGKCCELPYPCRFLRYDEDGLSRCAVYRWRPPSCRKYPRTAHENLTPQTCGFYFAEAGVSGPLVVDANPEPGPDAGSVATCRPESTA